MYRTIFTMILSFFFSVAYSQEPVFYGEPFKPVDMEPLKEQFGEFYVYRIDPVSLDAYAKEAPGARPFRLKLGNIFDWELEIAARTIRTKDYSIRLATESGIQELPVGENKAFRGSLLHPDGGNISLTLDHNFIYGFVVEGGEAFFIEPLWYFIPGSDEDLFVVYPASKVIPVEGKTCGVTEMHEHKAKLDPGDEPENGDCLTLELAIAADWSMRQKYGSNNGVINHTTGVMNNVQTNYDNEFNDEISYLIVEHWISSCSSCDPWTSSTNPSTLLNSFTNWGPNGFSAVHDLGQLWTNRNLDGNVIGIAWLSAVCTSYRYHLLQDFSSNANFLRVLTAHEIGHNFSATHDPSGSNTIMAPSVNSSNTWSAQSQNQINNYILSVDPPNGCLSYCPPPCSLTVSVNAVPPVICSGQSSTLTAFPSGGTAPYSYNWSNGGTQASITISPATTTAYSVTVTDAAGCEGTGSVTVTVSPPPPAMATNNSPLCEGGTLVLVGSGGVAYSWSGPNGFTSNQPNPSIPNVQLINAGSYSVTVTSAAGCTATASTIAVINPLPNATAGSNSPVCQGTAINLTASGGTSYSWSGPAGFTSNQQNPTIPNAQPVNGGQYTVTVTNLGCSATASATVVVNPSPTATAGSNSPLCEGQTIELTASGGGTFSWSGPNGFTSSQQNPTIPNATPANGGDYTVTVTSGGCSASASVSVTVTPLPVASAGNNSPLCAGTTLLLAASGGTNYSWSGPNGFTSSQQNPTIPNVQALNAGQYSVTVSNGACSATATSDVVVNPSPTATAAGNSPVCQNGTINLTASGGGAYSWSGPAGFSSTQQNPSIPNAQAPNSGLYTVTVTSAGCSSAASVNIAVTPLPNAGASSNAPVCQGGTLVLAGFGGGTYSWSGPNGFTSTQANPNLPNVQPANAGVYSVTVTTNGCSAIASTTVAINPAPAAAAGSNTPVCEGAALNLTASGGTSYSWSGPNGFSSNQQNPSIPNIQPANAGEYSVTVTSAGCSATVTTDVAVSSAPIASASVNSPVCEGADIELTASGGTSYTWSGPNGFTSNEQNPVIANAIPANGGTYTVTVSDGVCSDAASVVVSVTALPAASAGSNAPVCEGGTLALAASGGTSYSWSGPNGFASTQQNPSIPNVQSANAGEYSVVVTGSGCSASATTTVAVSSFPNPTAGSNTPVCIGSELSLTASGGMSYSWTGPAGFTSIEQNPMLPNAQSGNTGVYTVTVSNGACSASAETSVAVNPGPVATAQNNGPVCAGQPLQLSASGGGTYSWSGPNGFSSTEQNPVIPNSQPGNSGAYTATVTGPGCSSSATTTVTVNALPDPQAGSNTPLCEGETLQLTASGGESYAWSGPDGFSSTQQNPNIPDVKPLNSGIYSVTATAAGCTASDVISVIVNALPKPEAQTNSPVCEGDEIQLTASGGGTYSWTGPNGFSSADQNPVISNAQSANAGEYVVTVIVDGCSTDAQAIVAVNLRPEATAGSNEIVCEGDMIQLTASGGDMFSWTGPNGFSSEEQNPLILGATGANVGEYTVTVMTNGCSSSAETAVSVTPLPNATAAGDSPLCEGDPLQLEAFGGESYAWSGPGGFSSDLADPVLPAVQMNNGGMYTVVVTENGCSASAEVAVVVHPLPDAQVSANGLLCQGEALQLTASGGESYSWSGPNGFASTEQNPLIPNIQTGNTGLYTVVVSSAGCSSEAQTAVVVNAVSASTTVTDETCHDCDDGSATALGAGAGSYTYLWSNGATGQTITGLAPGTYTVTIAGDNGCTDVAMAMITPFGCPAIASEINLIAPPCFGDLGMVTIDPAGGTAPYDFLWSTGDTEQSIQVPAGQYSVSITDADGCPDTASVTVVEPEELLVFLESTPETCAGVCDGELMPLPSGGTGPYSFLWSGGQTDLCPGIYEVTITDANGCTVVEETEVGAGLVVTAAIEGDTLICAGETGILTASVGSAYLWSTGETTASIAWTEPGSYSVTVTEGLCPAGAELAVSLYPLMILEFAIIEDTLYAGVTGGTGDYTYEWSTGETTPWIVPETPGVYDVTVTDQAGCKVTGMEDFTVSASEVAALPIRIYPNPTLHSVFAEIPVGMEGWIYVYDLLGNQIVSQPTSLNEVDLSGQAPGTFMLQVIVGEQVYRIKVVRQ